MISNTQQDATAFSPSKPEPYVIVLEMSEDHPPRIEARTPGALINGACFILAVLVGGELHAAKGTLGAVGDTDSADEDAPEPTGTPTDTVKHLLSSYTALFDLDLLQTSYDSVLRVLRGEADERAEFDAFMRGERSWGLTFVTDTLDLVGSHVVTYLDRDFTLADADPTDPRTAILTGLAVAAGVIEHPAADTGIDMGIVFMTVILAQSLAAAEDIQANEFAREIEMHDWRESLSARGLSELEIELLGCVSLTTMLVLEAELSWEANKDIGAGFRKAALEVLATIPTEEPTPATATTPSVEEKLVEMMQLLHLDENGARTDCDIATLVNHIADVHAALPGNAVAVQEAVSWAVVRVMRMNGAMTAFVSAFDTTTDGLPDPMELARLLASG